ncbi:3-dehydroquinate synthase family protein [Ideonella paludis]
MIKYGPIFDTSFLSWLDAHMEDLVARDLAALRHAVVRSCQIKAEVVGQDERESGLRAILNFGHTFGHAIEAGMGYGVWLHGEAVGCGMVMAAELSRALGILEASDVNRMRALIQRAGLPVVGPAWPAQDYLRHMRVDKKAENGAIRFVVLEGLGKAVMRAADDETVSQVLARTCAPL